MFPKLLVTLILSIFSSGVVEHAIYLSVVDIRQGTISIKVFSDDLQDVIRNDSEEYIPTGMDQFLVENKELVNAYFNKYFKLSVNGKGIELWLVATKRENDAHFLYFTFKSDSNWRKVEVKGDFFTELFPDQSNVITILKDDKKHYARLTKSEPTSEITFD